MKYLILIMIILSLTMIMLSHPLSLGFILLIQTLMASFIINQLNYNYWFSYILFLIMIGGMLILFIYMTSIASNEKFMFSNNLLFLLMMTIFLMMLMLITDNLYFNTQTMNYETINMNLYFNYKFSMNKMFNFPNIYIFYLSIIYLLITLIAVVKIANMNMGPLRQKN
uniref:NADH-ubiquinone oxidoreductase chain 6 n=1 Tax=Cleroidea sp. 1 KM-2017 TaxID=2219306 RepID=A0A346RG29_9CUCU|nr:NADH dehydrogenase subunit 6 [Cleroidea sp. 1 KM-2017]